MQRLGLGSQELYSDDRLLARELNEYLNGKHERDFIPHPYVSKDRILPEFYSLPFMIVELDEENQPISKFLASDANGNRKKVKRTKLCCRRIAIKVFGPGHYLRTYDGKLDTELKPTTRSDLSLVEKLGYEVVVVDFRHIRHFQRGEFRRAFVENLALKHLKK